MTDVLVIGAGPFGLSISTHLRNRGIEHTIVGRPMNTWRVHMPLGLFLKSEPHGSVIHAPKTGYDIASYCNLHGFDDYVDRVGPLSLERFLDYADWFAEQLVPDIRDLTVTNITPLDGGFKVEFAEEGPLLARQVIVATGLMPYARLPRELSHLPADLMTHSSAWGDLSVLSGKRVAVLGGGQSSLQTGALLHEAGADVQIIVRKPEVKWEGVVSQEVGVLDYIRRPPVVLCDGWACVAYGVPDVFRLMPQNLRTLKATSTFGPSGAWWLRERVEGIVDILTGHGLKSAEPHGSGVRLHLDGPTHSTFDADHVIAGTGFNIDVKALPFLSDEITTRLKTTIKFATVNRAGESSFPGLYFAGAHTMTSLGPGVRFIAGTHHTSAQTVKSVARRLRKGPGFGKSAEEALEPLATAAGVGQPL
jgi:thioredoxin reductase